MAAQAMRIGYADGHFDETSLLQALESIDPGNVVGLAYGSGFETVPELLDKAAQYVPVIGNTSQVLRNLKKPRQFFMLLDVLKIPHPEVSFRPLESAAGWLHKQGGGSGGTHIRKALPLSSIAPKPGHYFQREIKGVPVSVLFAADGKQARVIGFNQQWLAPSPTMPYRYGGAVSHADLDETIKQQLTQAALQLTNAVGLRGLNSIDAVIENERAHMLEVNPRLTATFDLYQCASPPESGAALFELHIRACAGNMRDWPHLAETAKAHHIAYAPYAMQLPMEMEWPEWAADIPPAGSFVQADSPICTILAEGNTAEAARKLVLEREKELRDIIGQST